MKLLLPLLPIATFLAACHGGVAVNNAASSAATDAAVSIVEAAQNDSAAAAAAAHNTINDANAQMQAIDNSLANGADEGAGGTATPRARRRTSPGANR